MLSVKGGTQTWSNSAQSQTLERDESNLAGATDYKKYYGEKNLGEVLNQVADPNWVDPTKTRKVGNDSMGKDGFLKLFLAQLKNQDPTNPMQGHELAAQLAQFTSLEKLNNIDEGISTIAKNNSKPEGDFQILNLIGKSVAGDSSKILRSDQEQTHELRFNIARDSARVKLSVRDLDNQVVRTIEIPAVKMGTNSFDWNGLDQDGQPARIGQYNVDVEAFDASGQKIGVETSFRGKITGVNFSSGGPVLMIGNQAVRMQDVKEIFDSNISNNMDPKRMIKDPMVANSESAGPKGISVKESGKNVAPVGGNIGDLGLSREIAEKIKKETGENNGIL